MKIAITGPKIYSEHRWYNDHALIIVDGKISEITPHPVADEYREFPQDTYLIPGMIDMHIHGAKGADTMDATPEALQTLTHALPFEGTTSFLTSTMTASIAEIEAALTNVAAFKNDSGAEILGIHLEGPFISAECAGAQRRELVRDPDVALFEKWLHLSKNMIKMVTLAPELKNAEHFIQCLMQHNIIGAIGHSHADYETTLRAIELGCHHATHLFNAMGRFHYRDPSTTGALLFSKSVTAELIADLHHVHADVLKFVYEFKKNHHTILITDAMRAKCCTEGEFDLGGQTVRVTDQQARLSDGTLAGSILKMNQAAKNMWHATGCNLEDIVQMTSLNQAQLLKIDDRKGDLSCGKDADFVIIDSLFNVKTTCCRGILFD